MCPALGATEKAERQLSDARAAKSNDFTTFQMLKQTLVTDVAAVTAELDDVGSPELYKESTLQAFGTITLL